MAIKIILFFVCLCVFARMCVRVLVGVGKRQKRVLGSLELGFQEVVSLLTQLLGTKLQ